MGVAPLMRSLARGDSRPDFPPFDGELLAKLPDGRHWASPRPIPGFNGRWPAGALTSCDEWAECPHCGGARLVGYVPLAPVGRGAAPAGAAPSYVRLVAECRCDEFRRRQRLADEAERRWAERRRGPRRPAAYEGLGIDVSGIVAAIDAGRWPYLYGPFRSGKTARAVLVRDALAERGTGVRLATCDMMLRDIRAAESWSSEGGSAAAVQRWGRVPVLILDDMAKEAVSARGLSDLFAVVNMRSEARLPTMMTANHSLEKLCGQYEAAGAVTARAIRERVRELADEILVKRER